MDSRYKIPALSIIEKLYVTQERKVIEEEERLEPKGALKLEVRKYQESR